MIGSIVICNDRCHFSEESEEYKFLVLFCAVYCCWSASFVEPTIVLLKQNENQRKIRIQTVWIDKDQWHIAMNGILVACKLQITQKIHIYKSNRSSLFECLRQCATIC